uniref:Uncharacterized protein n=1 Tax=Anopheles farauti TaxID=69004 RepID=A0A182QYH7_9DIPT
MDEVTKFKAWATKLGCPPEIIPPDETLRKAFRGEQSAIFQQIIEKIRPRQEIASMRKNVLVHKLQIHKKTDTIVANASFNTLPVELQRYIKIQKLKKKIEETRHRIKQSISGVESYTLQIKDKNVQKLKLSSELEELYGKVALYAAHETMLKSKLEKEAQLSQRIEHIMPIKGSASTCRPGTAEKAVERCVQLLEAYYDKCQDLNPETSRALQEALWSDIRAVLRGIPNHLLWNVLMTLKDKNLRDISEDSSRRVENENTCVTLSERDLLQTSMAKLCTGHINVFLELVSTRNAVNAAGETYRAKFTLCTGELEAKISLLNVMDAEAEEVLEEYVMQWNTREYNQGQIEYMVREIERKKQEATVLVQKVQNHEQLLGQLRGIYGQVESISKHMESELQQVRQIKEKIHYTRYVCQHTVHTMRQKANNNSQTLNVSDQSLCRLDSTTMVAPVYNPVVLPPYVQELEAFRQIPLSKYSGLSKAALLTFGPNVAVFFEPSTMLTLLPCTGVSADVSLKQLADLQTLEQAATRAMTVDTGGTVALPSTAEHDQLEQRWKLNHDKICEMLDKIETLTNCAQQTAETVRKYYNFALANSLRKFVPSTKLFASRSYREYENEYLMYYRMIYGFGGN